MNNKGLSVKQQVFVQEYLIDLNATAAYKRAGYKGTGRTAANAASRMLGFAGIKEAIAEALAKRERWRKSRLTKSLRTGH